MKSLFAKLLLVAGGGMSMSVVDAFLAASRLNVDQTGAWWLQVLTLLAGGGGALTTGALMSRGASVATDTKAAFAALVTELADHPQREQLLGPVREALIADAVEDFKKANEFPPVTPPPPPAPKVVVTPTPAPAPTPAPTEATDAPKA